MFFQSLNYLAKNVNFVKVTVCKLMNILAHIWAHSFQNQNSYMLICSVKLDLCKDICHKFWPSSFELLGCK